MGAKTQAFDIFPTPLISHYPLPLILTLYLSEFNTDNLIMIRILVGRGEPHRRSFRHRVCGLGDGCLEAAALREDTNWWVLICSVSWNFTWSVSCEIWLLKLQLYENWRHNWWVLICSVSWNITVVCIMGDGAIEAAALQIGEFWSVPVSWNFTCGLYLGRRCYLKHQLYEKTQIGELVCSVGRNSTWS